MITPLSLHTGAEVSGVDLTQPVDAALRERLNRAFVEHSVLVFRDQHLSPPQLLEAVRLFGEVFPQHNTRFALPECPQIHYISNQDCYPGRQALHSRRGLPHRPLERRGPPKATVLHAVNCRTAAATRSSSTCSGLRRAARGDAASGSTAAWRSTSIRAAIARGS